jgi:hypothetical protein
VHGPAPVRRGRLKWRSRLPLLLVQVTRLLCGGFVFAIRLNRTICDAIGLARFTSVVADLARSLPPPKAAPTWSRELLEVRSPLKPAFPHREFQRVRSAYQPPVSSTFLSEQTSHQKPASSTLLLEQTSTSH